MARSLDSTSLTPEEQRVIARLAPALEAELHARSVWLYGSRARREPPRPESDVDLLIVAPGKAWDNLGRAYRVLHEIARDEGVNPMRFALQVFDEDWLAGRRAINSFFIREVDRDKVVLAGQP
jgi:predicted nucleotidyltransferase